MTTLPKVTRQRRSHRLLGGQLKIDALLAFAFGVIFVSAILYFATTVVNPSPFQIRTFQTVLALAGAGVAAMIPGQFEFRHLPFVRAGGAIAVFALIYLTPMALVSSVGQIKVPPQRPDATVERFLATLDRFDYPAAWAQLDPASPAWNKVDEGEWLEMYRNTRTPLGKLVRRTIISRGGGENPAGFPPGVYRSIIFASKFEHSNGCVGEGVVVRATGEVEWQVFGHQIMLNPAPCLGEQADDPSAKPPAP